MAVAAAATRPQAPDLQAQRTPQRPQQASPPFSRSPDVTDAPSEAESSAPSPAGKAESEDEAQRARAASRIERKNRARLQRYHQSKAELTELRAEVVELRALLEKLKKEDGAGIEQSIATAPSPFAFSEELEINAKERAPPKMKVVTVGPSAASWREVAVLEHKKLQRAQTVKRKLMRIVAEFGQQCDTFVSMSAIVDELDAAAGVAANHLRLYQAPRVPGMDSLAAFTHNSMPVLQELYHMAASHSGITPLSSSALPKNYSGGSLAYSLFLGPEIEFSWSDGFELPGDDPAHVTSVWMRAISSQPPQPNIVKATHKSHNTEHPMYERRVTYRQSPGDILAKQTHGVKFMQKFESKDNVVIVWSRAYNVGVDADLSLFRASGWLSITKSTDSNGSPCCLLRYVSRVHCATALSEEQAKLVKRSDIIGLWATSIRSKQEKMQQRLLLLA